MVLHFKKQAGKEPAYAITRDNVESLLGRRAPWFKQGRERDDDRHFAVCPYCNNPIQLKGVYVRKDNSPRAYGSHSGTAVDGFPFNAEDLAFCPYKLKRKSLDKSARRTELGSVARQLIAMAVAEFDRVVLVLRDDFGFRFSNPFARKMLEQWFDSRGYLYEGAHLRNLPWMIAYFGPAQTLYGQRVGDTGDLAQAIRRAVPQADIVDGQLREKERKRSFFRIDLQCLHHRVLLDDESGHLTEHMRLRVQDFTKTNDPEEAPLIYEKTIEFDPDRFERLLHTAPDRARRDENLLMVARDVAMRKGFGDA
ncbi:putative uncharacterized protein [Burkholderiales bacterium GJ-E10]|nr:putative uncharacterized protein [Burkholderiales bacterium GJ-E10]